MGAVLRLGILAVPFFLVDTHRAYAELTLSTVQSSHEVVRIAVINRCRPEKGDDSWIRQQFDTVLTNDQNILARAWNQGIEVAFAQGCDYVAVINLDVLFHPEHFDNLIAFAEETKDKMLLWSGCGVAEPELVSAGQSPGIDTFNEVDFCAFLVDRRLFEVVGQFDEQFAPAYHEDKDMLYRMKLSGERGLATRRAAFFHFERGTQAGLLEEFYARKGVEIFGDPALGAKVMHSVEEIQTVEELYADTSMALFGETTIGVEATYARYLKKWGGPPSKERFTIAYQK